ncbi:uncharacterized protein I303_107995 [Kwoniella dejecticola CBS 10117]|uniref:Uncharacterized protein n=1 Tax=Kwoniella dejecticola CBS 10117 TaxID=1296121 RepID=A0A1A5ZW90_9TREE|nr:uncharacterized protein I303_07986 [Kwoniella dejecticola CBS 10117]OBR82072.1 hypothetical protein I303_07986 [Kwoniella dejecticola CBS 10117]
MQVTEFNPVSQVPDHNYQYDPSLLGVAPNCFGHSLGDSPAADEAAYRSHSDAESQGLTSDAATSSKSPTRRRRPRGSSDGRRVRSDGERAKESREASKQRRRAAETAVETSQSRLRTLMSEGGRPTNRHERFKQDKEQRRKEQHRAIARYTRQTEALKDKLLKEQEAILQQLIAGLTPSEGEEHF